MILDLSSHYISSEIFPKIRMKFHFTYVQCSDMIFPRICCRSVPLRKPCIPSLAHVSSNLCSSEAAAVRRSIVEISSYSPSTENKYMRLWNSRRNTPLPRLNLFSKFLKNRATWPLDGSPPLLHQYLPSTTSQLTSIVDVQKQCGKGSQNVRWSQSHTSWWDQGSNIRAEGSQAAGV